MTSSVRKIEPWRAIYKSWYSRDIYREAAHRWRGLGFRYLIMLLLGLWIIASINVHMVVRNYAVGYLLPMVKQLPKFTIKNGILTTERPEKFIEIRSPRDQKPVVTFDLRDKPTLPPLAQDGIFLESRRVIFHANGEEHTYDFSKMKDSDWEWSYHIKALEALGIWTGFVVLGLFWLSSFILCALQAMVYALAGKVFTMIAKRRLTYPQLVRISVVALTPPLIIDTCQKLVLHGIPAWPLVSVAITLGFIAYGVKVNSVSFEWSLTQGVSPKTAEKNSTV